MIAHAAGLALHWLNWVFNYYDYKILATFFIVAKMIIYFILMI